MGHDVTVVGVRGQVKFVSLELCESETRGG